MTEKRALRRQNFARLQELSCARKEAQSKAIVAILSRHSSFIEAETVFSYAAMPSEPDLDALRSTFPEKRWGLSRVADDGQSLSFHRVAPGVELTRSDYGFLEPDPKTSPLITQPDLILIPGVGFDPSTKARLGRGKGHYDRYLGPLKLANTPPTLIGVCFSIQETEIPVEAHDVSMDFLVTENGLI
ncbi:MAG: 5-formyltetrahydrofolate cyclo-ligase [Verrucomicrobiales bacterium]|nr:5-formyltetrahydrofolate cyclo-ligase [Verrucomicrobiales bacterium]